MIVVLLLIIGAAYKLFTFWKRRKIYALHRILKNETWTFPVLGNSLQFLGQAEDRMNAFIHFSKIATKQGGFTSLWLGSRYFVVTVDAEAAKLGLKTFLEKDDVQAVIRELLGNGTLMAPLKFWRSRRKMIAPTFSMKNLNQFVGAFSRQSNIMVERLKELTGKGTVSVWNQITSYTMNSVCETTLGVRTEPPQRILDALQQYCQIIAFIIILPQIVRTAYKFSPTYKLYTKQMNIMCNFVDSIITNKRKEMTGRVEARRKYNTNGDKEETKQTNLLEELIEPSRSGSGLTNIELREETLVMFIAGTDTSAVGISFTCLMLARHPDVQEKVYQEIVEVLSETNDPITPIVLPKLQYLEAVIKESLRLYPPVPFTARKVDSDLKLPTGLTIVKGAGMIISIWGVHRNPKYWGDDADDFRPDRFIGSTLGHPQAFIPFGDGPRSCLGYQYSMMSMKTALVNIVRHYRLLPATPMQDKNAPLRVKFDVMLKHVENFELQIEPRK